MCHNGPLLRTDARSVTCREIADAPMSATRDHIETQFVEDSRADLIRFVSSRVANTDDALSIVQESYLKFFQAGYRANSNDARPLLFTIARNILNDHYRHTQKRANLMVVNANQQAEAELPDPRPDLPESLDNSRLLNAVIRVIEQMPPKRQEVFKLSRFEGLKNGEISRQLDISVSMVEKHLAAALKDLRTAFSAELPH